MTTESNTDRILDVLASVAETDEVRTNLDLALYDSQVLDSMKTVELIVAFVERGNGASVLGIPADTAAQLSAVLSHESAISDPEWVRLWPLDESVSVITGVKRTVAGRLHSTVPMSCTELT